MGRRVAVVGVGFSRMGHRRDDVTHPELAYEAVNHALEHAGLTVDDIDAVVYGTMDPFDGVLSPEVWDADAAGVSRIKPLMKVTTGGTTGMSIALTAHTLVASGLFDVVIALGAQRVGENVEAQKVLNAATDPVFDRPFGLGAIHAAAFQAVAYMDRVGSRRRVEEAMAMVAVKNRLNALRNPYAHLKLRLTFEEAMNSPYLVWPIRLADSCPSSDGAAAVIFASEDKARRIRDNPAWILAAGTISDTYYFGAKDQAFWDSLAILARRVYRMAHIDNPRKEINVFELYDAFSIQEIMEYEAVGLAPKWSGYRLIEEGVTEIDGDVPVNPSGGVLSTNPIGATGLVRVGEAALQVMGEAGDRQVDDVDKALAHAWGGAIQFHGIMILGRNPR